MMSSTLPATAAALVSLVAVAPYAAADTDTTVRLMERPSELRGGDGARVVVLADDVDVCRLELRIEGGETRESARARTDGKARITWRWGVPVKTASGTLEGSVLCWGEPLPDGSTPASSGVSRSFEGRLHGTRSRTPRAVDARGIAATVRRVADGEGVQVTDVAAVLGAAAAVFGLPAVALGLVLTRRQAQSEETRRIIDRYGDDEVQGRWLRTQALLEASDSKVAVEQVRRWEAAASNSDPIEAYGVAGKPGGKPVNTSRKEVFGALNFFEEVAALWNLGKLDTRQVFRTFGPIMPQALEASWWWIQYQRDGERAAARVPVVREGETGLWSEWERMVRTTARPKVRRLEEEVFNREGLDDSVRALCLPERGSGDADEWTAYGELSLKVAQLLASPTGEKDLRKALADAPPSEATTRRDPLRTVLVPAWREHLREPRRLWRGVYSVGARLDRRSTPLLSILGRWIADRDARVRRHKELHELTVLLDRKIKEMGDLNKVLTFLPKPRP
jgi:hypothetical protein